VWADVPYRWLKPPIANSPLKKGVGGCSYAPYCFSPLHKSDAGDAP